MFCQSRLNPDYLLFWAGGKGEELLCFRILAEVAQEVQRAAVAGAVGWAGSRRALSPWLDRGAALAPAMQRKDLRGFSLWQFGMKINTLLQSV